ncbi:hypothetical protein Tco_0298863 [Tanacetum coccineum]
MSELHQDKLILAVPIASPTLLLFHDDPFMKVMQAYYAKESPIPPPTIVPPSPILSPMFNPQEFFVPEELLPLKKQTHLPLLSTDLSNTSQQQACILHHEKQIDDILNYLGELSFHRIEKLEEILVNGWMIIPRDFDELKTELEKVCSHITGLQKKRLGQREKIALARFWIADLEQTLKDI